MRWWGGTAVWLAAAALAAAPAPAADRFVDPLDLPAGADARASRSPLTAVAAAGTRLVAVGQRGLVLWSDDGGERWTQAAVPVSTDLTAVHFVSAKRGWAVGHDGAVLATADGGRSWARQLDRRTLGALPAGPLRSPSVGEVEASLLDTWFDDERRGYAVGAFGLVLRTEDGGRTWVTWSDRADNPRALHLYAVRRVDGALVVAGEQGLLLRLDTGWAPPGRAPRPAGRQPVRPHRPWPDGGGVRAGGPRDPQRRRWSHLAPGAHRRRGDTHRRGGPGRRAAGAGHRRGAGAGERGRRAVVRVHGGWPRRADVRGGGGRSGRAGAGRVGGVRRLALGRE